MSETEPVRFEVVGIERVSGAGRLVGLAIVRVEVAGIEFTLQGVQLIRDVGNLLSIKAPMFRHPRTGKWLPAVILPPELGEAMGAEVLAVAGGDSG